MQSKSAHTGSVFCITLAIMVIPLFTVIAQTQAPKDAIKLLIEADEFKANEREMLLALPIEVVPLLTVELKNIPNDQNHTRSFFLLATKVAQCEAQLEAPHRDAAVNALLARIRPGPNPPIDEAVSIRGNLKQLSGISDQRIIDAIRAARAALDGAAERNEATPLSNSLTLPVKPTSPTPKAPEAKPSTSSEEPTSSTPWSVMVVLIVAACVLLWLLLKRRS